LRWLLQEKVQETMATVLRDNLVRFERLPMVVRLPDLLPWRPKRRSGSQSGASTAGRDARVTLRGACR
jgi:hypothetical protein